MSVEQELAAVIPYFPYKNLERFYDMQGLLKHPALFQKACDTMADRYKEMGITKVAGFEARGFLFTPVAVRLGVPFIMLRKTGKMPNTVSSAPYTKEYEGVDVMCMQRGAVVEGDKVLLIDDLLATGGTLCSGIELVKSMGASVIECGCLVELKALKGHDRCIAAGATGAWGLLSEELLTVAAELPDNYVDDGTPH